MLTALTIEEAKKIISDNTSFILESETVDIERCLGRIIAEDIISEFNVPGFKRSTMDGFAVVHTDLEEANAEIPVKLKVLGEIEIGTEPKFNISQGECVYIPTGGMLPTGADSILIIEKVEKLSSDNIIAYDKTFEGENIVLEDEDVSIGEIVIKKGVKIRPYEIGVLSCIGCTSIKVFKKPRIGILASGDEIVSPYIIPKVGQVRDVNTYLLSALINENSCEAVIYNVVNDNFDKLFKNVEKAINECDMVLISGGSSVGLKDYTLKVLRAMENSKILMHGLALKPGKPTIVSKYNNKLIFGMPGHPLSGAVVFKTLVCYYINQITSHIEKDYPVFCEMTTDRKKTRGREEYIPVIIEEKGDKLLATPMIGKSGIITTFSKSWGYFKTPKELDIVKAGETVRVYRL
jgi:molybdopterin molybdotransferase